MDRRIQATVHDLPEFTHAMSQEAIRQEVRSWFGEQLDLFTEAQKLSRKTDSREARHLGVADTQADQGTKDFEGQNH